MEVTFENVITIVGWITSLVGVYTAMKVRITRLESEVEDLKNEELPRLDRDLEKRRQDVIKLFDKAAENSSKIQDLKIEVLETFATKQTVANLRKDAT